MKQEKTPIKFDEEAEDSLDIELVSITVSSGMTLNLGNYESARVDAEVTLRSNKIPKTKEEFLKQKDRLFSVGWKIINAQLIDKVKTIREAK